MKKAWIVTFIFLFCFSAFSACQKGETANQDILFLKNDMYDEITSCLEDASCIPQDTKRFVAAEKQGNEKEFSFLGQAYRLVYRETIQYVVGDITADIYQLEGQRDTHVLFLEDGRLYGFLQPPVVTLKMDRKAAKEEVAEELMRVLSPEIDFSQYRQWECEQSVPGMEKEEGTGFGLYLFTWYNTKNGIMTDDFLRVAVQDNGQVSGLVLKGNAGHSFAEIRDDVSVEDYRGIIEEKMREVLSKRACTLLAARTRNCSITVYQGEYYLNCTVGVEYSTATGNQAAEAITVLVKV